MRSSNLSRPSSPSDQQESEGIRVEKCVEMEGSEGKADRMSLWSALALTNKLPQRTGVAR